jgi:hypothetical protein
MQLFSRTRLVLTVLACGLSVNCGSNPAAPSLATVDPATVVFSDDFEGENNQVGVYNWTSFANWNVLDGCVDLHGNGFHDVQPGKGLYVDLDGSCDAGGTLETKSTFTLEAGNYVLEFWMAGNQRISDTDTVNVTVGSYQEQFVLQHNDKFALRTRNFSVPAQTTVRIRFQNLGGDGRGALLDLVRLRRAT